MRISHHKEGLQGATRLQALIRCSVHEAVGVICSHSLKPRPPTHETIVLGKSHPQSTCLALLCEHQGMREQAVICIVMMIDCK